MFCRASTTEIWLIIFIIFFGLNFAPVTIWIFGCHIFFIFLYKKNIFMIVPTAQSLTRELM